MSDVAPYEVGDRILHPARGAGMVVHAFRQERGERAWVCWVTFFKGEQHAVAAAHLTPDPAFRRSTSAPPKEKP